ncbi:unnamed protein product [Gemmata massiliana]|uniref:Uncharacterized protein n=1 Tax=Gemmata massiliana TaxID=1210884 RepID=A0A6P2CSE0_9BACT|nr:hypothetical protein [Gemmata massiliana]VTR91859.1 unnamed protein product [Gemmata massiliana]
MASNTIGTGAVVLTADADGLLTGLKKAEKDTESWASRTGRKIAAAADRIGNSFGGGANEAFNPLKDAAKGAVVDLAKQGAQAFLKWASGADGLNRLLASTERTLTQIGDQIDRIAAARMETVDAFVKPKDIASSLDVEIRRGEAEKERLLALIKTAEDEREALEKFNFRTTGLRIAGNLDRFQGAADTMVGSYRDQLGKLNSRLLDMADRRGRILNPDRDPAKIGELNRLVEASERQIAAMGKAEHQIKALELAADGYSKNQVAKYEFYADRLKKTAEGFEYVANAVGTGAGIIGGADYEKMKAVTDAIKKQGDTLGFTADQIQIYDLRLQGFADRQLKEIEKLQQSTTMLTNIHNLASSIANGVKDTKIEPGGPYLAGAAVGGSTEAYSRVANFRAGNAVAGGTMSDNPVQIAKENLKNTKEQIRKLQRLIDLMERSQFIKVVT